MYHIGINATVFKNPVTGVAKRLISLLKKAPPAIKKHLVFYCQHHQDIPFKARIRRSSSISESYWNNRLLPGLFKKDEVLLFDSQWGGGLPVSRTDNSPVFFTTIHDTIPLDMENPIRRFFFRRRLQRQLDIADQVITVSEYTRKCLLDNFRIQSAKIIVSPNGIGPEFRRMRSTELKRKTPTALRKNPAGRFILYVGGFNRRKNVENLVRAFSLLIRDNDEIRLVLGGSQSSYFHRRIAPLIKKEELTEKVILPGYIPEKELPWYYNSAEMLVYPSLLEGFGMPPLEAMACGCPVAAHKGSAVTEICRGSALLSDCRQPEKILKNMKSILRGGPKIRELVKKGQKKSRDYSWKKIAADYFTLYKKWLDSI